MKSPEKFTPWIAAPEYQAGSLKWRFREPEEACPLKGPFEMSPLNRQRSRTAASQAVLMIARTPISHWCYV